MSGVAEDGSGEPSYESDERRVIDIAECQLLGASDVVELIAKISISLSGQYVKQQSQQC